MVGSVNVKKAPAPPSKPAGKAPVKMPTSSLLDQMPDAWDLVDSLKIALYGRSATGKTHVWGTFPGPTLALICSGGGRRPGELKTLKAPGMREKIKAVVVNDTDTLFKLLDVDGPNFATGVMDHVTSLQDLAMKEVCGFDDIPVQQSWGLVKREQWLPIGNKVKLLLRRLLDLPSHSVIVGQQRGDHMEDQEDASSIMIPNVGIAVTPAVQGWIYSSVDYYAQTFIRPKMVEERVKIGNIDQTKLVRAKDGEVEYCLRTGPHDLYSTKFRMPIGEVGRIPQVIVNPTFEKIQAIINGK